MNSFEQSKADQPRRIDLTRRKRKQLAGSLKGLFVISILLTGLVVSVAKANPEAPASHTNISRQPFFQNELARPYFSSEQAQKAARQALLNLRAGELGAMRVNAKQAAQSLKARKNAWKYLTDTAQAMRDKKELDKALIFDLIALEASSIFGGIDQSQTNALLIKIADTLSRPLCEDFARRRSGMQKVEEATKPIDAETEIFDKDERQRLEMSSAFYGRALGLLQLGKSLDKTNAEFLLRYSDVESRLSRWQNLADLLEKWRHIYEKLGESPPANALPDVLLQTARAKRGEKLLPDAENLLRESILKTRTLNQTTITPISGTDLMEPLVIVLLEQGKVDEARETARRHFAERQITGSLSNDERARIMTELAEKFENAGELSYASQLRRQATDRHLPLNSSPSPPDNQRADK